MVGSSRQAGSKCDVCVVCREKKRMRGGQMVKRDEDEKMKKRRG